MRKNIKQLSKPPAKAKPKTKPSGRKFKPKSAKTETKIEVQSVDEYQTLMGGQSEVIDYNSNAHRAKMTEGYTMVPREDFPLLTQGDHIRFIDAGGNFRPGGYIWYRKEKADDTGNMRTFWMIGYTPNMPSPESEFSHKRYCVYWDNIQVLYKRISVEADLLRKSIDLKQAYIQDITLFLYKKFGDEFANFMNSREEKRVA